MVELTKRRAYPLLDSFLSAPSRHLRIPQPPTGNAATQIRTKGTFKHAAIIVHINDPALPPPLVLVFSYRLRLRVG